MGISLNDVIFEALDPVYGPADITTDLYRWMLDVGINPWSQTAIRAYIVTQEPSYGDLSYNDMLYLYFLNQFHVGFALLLETGDQILQETGDFILLDT